MHSSIKNIIHYNYSNLSNCSINIGYGINDKFSRCTAASIISFCQNNPNKKIHFHIISLDLSIDSKIRLKTLAKEKHIYITIYEANPYFFANLPVKINLPIPAYFRFILPLILKEYKKIFYIDADILCLKNAEDFFNIKLDNYIIAAIPDDRIFNSRNSALNLTDHTYFNSGVLIINVQKWLALNITEKLLSILQKTPHLFIYPDQDALNIILTKNIKYIEQKFNYAINKNMSSNSDVVLLHYVHKPKPWELIFPTSSYINKYNKDFYNYYEALTPFKNLPLLEPITYKEMHHYSKYLYSKKYYIKSLKYFLLYVNKKIKSKLKY